MLTYKTNMNQQKGCVELINQCAGLKKGPMSNSACVPAKSHTLTPLLGTRVHNKVHNNRRTPHNRHA
jgi:hypothetical protein